LLRGDQFAVALALIEDGRPIVGALACPRYDRFGDGGCLALAVRNGGAWAAPIDGNDWTRLGVSPTADPSGAVLLRSVESDSMTNRKLTKIRRALGMAGPEVRMDSQVKYLGLASAEGDLLIRLPRLGGGRENIWDHAAGVLLVEEAGGRASDLNGDGLDFGAGRMMTNNLGVLASNGPLHAAALEALRRVALSPHPSPAPRGRGRG
jgi:3'(2'), 5'-bisphosphate nucleotidase